jgi:hypothetical protein
VSLFDLREYIAAYPLRHLHKCRSCRKTAVCDKPECYALYWGNCIGVCGALGWRPLFSNAGPVSDDAPKERRKHARR